MLKPIDLKTAQFKQDGMKRLKNSQPVLPGIPSMAREDNNIDMKAEALPKQRSLNQLPPNPKTVAASNFSNIATMEEARLGQPPLSHSVKQMPRMPPQGLSSHNAAKGIPNQVTAYNMNKGAMDQAKRTGPGSNN